MRGAICARGQGDYSFHIVRRFVGQDIYKCVTQVNKKQIYNYFIHALNYSIQDKMDSVLSEHDNINKNNHPVSIFCRTKVIIGQINQLGWNMVLLTLLNLAKIVNFAKFCSFQVINLSKISKK